MGVFQKIKMSTASYLLQLLPLSLQKHLTRFVLRYVPFLQTPSRASHLPHLLVSLGLPHTSHVVVHTFGY